MECPSCEDPYVDEERQMKPMRKVVMHKANHNFHYKLLVGWINTWGVLDMSHWFNTLEYHLNQRVINCWLKYINLELAFSLSHHIALSPLYFQYCLLAVCNFMWVTSSANTQLTHRSNITRSWRLGQEFIYLYRLLRQRFLRDLTLYQVGHYIQMLTRYNTCKGLSSTRHVYI